MSDIIEIVCGIDSNYAPHLAVMLKSLTKYNQKHHFRVHVLHDGVPDELCRRVQECNKEMEINWINAANHQVLGFERIGHISRAAYLRLMMSEVLDPAISRALYLDVDIIINGDILPLWTAPLGGKTCAAVADAWIDAAKFAEKWHLSGQGRYFNSGVMLLDLDKLRNKQYMVQAIRLIATPNHGFRFPDQDALNIVLWNDWVEVDPGWNFQRQFLIDHYAAWNALSPHNYQPAIVHYTETWKPWKKTEWHPCQWLYLSVLFKTPFKSSVLKSGGINFYYLCKSWLKWMIKRPPMFCNPRRKYGERP